MKKTILQDRIYKNLWSEKSLCRYTTYTTEIVLKWKEGEDIVIDIAHTNSDVRTLPDAINCIHSQTADNNIH